MKQSSVRAPGPLRAQRRLCELPPLRVPPVAQNSTLAVVQHGEWGDNRPRTWPNDVRLQLHIVERDEDFDFAQKLAPTVPTSELLSVPAPSTISPARRHAAAVLTQRVFAFFGDA